MVFSNLLQLVSVEGKIPNEMVHYAKLSCDLCCYDNTLVLCVLWSSGPPPASDSDLGKVRASTPLELWKKVFEKTFPAKVGMDMPCIQLLFSQNSTNTPAPFCLSTPLTGISVFQSHLAVLFNTFFKDKGLYVAVLLHLQSPFYI